MSDVSVGLGALYDYNTGYLTSLNYSFSDTAKIYRDKAESSWNYYKNQLSDLTNKYKNISANTNNRK